jgi:hypothetical protein
VNADGTVVNQNLYPAPSAVYLNGGPNCGAPRHAAALPDGDYVFRVTTTNGRTTLSSQPLADREFSVDDGVVVSATAPMLPQACGEGMTVQVGPFAESKNGVYKLWIAPARYGAKFPAKASKTDNFKVAPSGFDVPDDPPDDDPPDGPSF